MFTVISKDLFNLLLNPIIPTLILSSIQPKAKVDQPNIKLQLIMKELVQWAQKAPKIAYLYVVIGNLTLAIGQIIFKDLTTYLHPFHATFLRSFFVSVVNVALMRRQNRIPYITSPQIFSKVVIRSIVNNISFALMLYCLAYVPVSTVTTIYNMGPIFIFFIQIFHYKHAINLTNFFLTLLSFVGVVFMVQPQFLFGANEVPKADNYTFYVILMILSAFANALNMHLVHSLAKKVDPFVNIHYSHLVMIITSGFMGSFTPSTMEPAQFDLKFVILIVGMAVAGVSSINLILFANTLKKPSLMMPFGYIGVATGFLADVYLFGTEFTFTTILGIFLTSGGLLSGFLIQKDKKQTVKSKEQQEVVQRAQQNQDILMFLDQKGQIQTKK